MTCEETRAALLIADPEALTSPHLADCASCRELAEAIRSGSGDLDRALDAFAQSGDIDAALKRAIHQPRPTRRFQMFSSKLQTFALIAAVAAALVAAVRTMVPNGAAPAAPPVEQLGDCGAQETLELQALEGALSADSVTCLSTVEGDDWELANRVLMVHHFAGEEMDAWEKRARLHIEGLRKEDRVDPDLSYKMALHLSGEGVPAFAEVTRLAEEALDARDTWTDEDTRVSRVNSLYKLRAAAAMKEWQRIGESGKDDGDIRIRVKITSLEWLEYAVKNGKPTETAEQLCTAAHGMADPCDPEYLAER